MTEKKQQNVMRGEPKSSNVEGMTFKMPGINGVNYKRVTKSHSNQPNTATHTPPRHSQKQMCTRCGKTPFHAKQLCPAIKAECKKCGKRGHYQSMCRTVQIVSELKTEYIGNSDDSFLLTIDNISLNSSDAWTVDLIVNDIPIQFKN